MIFGMEHMEGLDPSLRAKWVEKLDAVAKKINATQWQLTVEQFREFRGNPARQDPAVTAYRALSPSAGRSRRPYPCGDVLAAILTRIGVHQPAGCSCKSMQARMNQWGFWGCMLNIEAIVRHLLRQARGEY